MTAIEELAATLAAVRDAFARLGVTWAVGGSLASAAYGEPRSTNDIDVIAALSDATARALGPSLGPDFYCSDEAAVEAVRRRDSFNVIEVPVLGPEDVVLQKLRWYRMGGEVSDRQWRDIVAVLRGTAGGDLDAAYLDEVAADGGLAALLDRARRDAT